MRLLLKVLAVSDVVVYRTRAERLHNDMFQFLGSASSAYLRHFTRELRALSSRCGLEVPLSSLGPAVIVFQETSSTRLLGWVNFIIVHSLVCQAYEQSDLGLSYTECKRKYTRIVIRGDHRTLQNILEGIQSRNSKKQTKDKNAGMEIRLPLHSVHQLCRNICFHSYFSFLLWLPVVSRNGMTYEDRFKKNETSPSRNKEGTSKESSTPGQADILLQKRFHELGLSTEAFCSVQYVGTQTVSSPTDYSGLLSALKQQVRNTATRSPRPPAIVYSALQALSDRFSGEISVEKVNLYCFFPDEYFTCSSVCLSCGVRCKNGMNHLRDNIPHLAEGLCQYAHQYNNKVLICKKCYEGGREVIVIPKTSASNENPWFGLAVYAWSGYVLECPCCGIIYRSRQYWIGNQDPESCVVRPEVKHVWPGSETFLTDHRNAAQRMLDGMNFVIQSVSDYSSGPTKAVTAWITDQVAPPYWRPNADITACSGCEKLFEEPERKHHCRACGEGFCQACSSKTMPVPERGWGSAPVRVCDSCYRQGGGGSDVSRTEPVGLMARKVTEVAQSTVDFVSTAIDYPLGFIKGVARPDYWVPDHEIQQCGHCSKALFPRMSKHHCRACGGGFCAQCSSARRPVPSRGWDHPVRVCTHCSQNKGEL
ncbi:ZFYV1 protein, partial [Polyodon spathula]|nr:ZFYV1 protein [Polyodon spathula]